MHSSITVFPEMRCAVWVALARGGTDTNIFQVSECSINNGGKQTFLVNVREHILFWQTEISCVLHYLTIDFCPIRWNEFAWLSVRFQGSFLCLFHMIFAVIVLSFISRDFNFTQNCENLITSENVSSIRKRKRSLSLLKPLANRLINWLECCELLLLLR